MGKAPTTSKFASGRNSPPRETLVEEIQERSGLKAYNVKNELGARFTSKEKVGVHSEIAGLKPPYKGTSFGRKI